MPRAAVLLALVAHPAIARADHDHGAQHVGHASASGGDLRASLALVAARYENDLYVGDYQGVTPAARYARGPISVGANVSIYRLTANGATYYGPGDVVVDGQAKLVGDHPASAGASLAVSLPAGSQRHGLGMGHVMLMPSAWGMYMLERVMLTGSVGYGRALGAGAHAHHAGGGALVDPMNTSEVTWSAQGDVTLARALTAGARMLGGVPVGSDGTTRVIGGVRVVWTEGRVTTSAEVQGGFAGDPFEVRGVLATAVRL